MTSQAELIELGKKHADKPGVSVLMQSIEEGRISASLHLNATQTLCATYKNAQEGVSGYTVPADSSGLVLSAAKASAAMMRLSADFMNLATLLQSLGEQVEY